MPADQDCPDQDCRVNEWHMVSGACVQPRAEAVIDSAWDISQCHKLGMDSRVVKRNKLKAVTKLNAGRQIKIADHAKPLFNPPN
jgi:hypothetical protein